MQRTLSSLSAGVLLFTTAASAQVTPVCTETFEYPIGSSFHGTPGNGTPGATGWSNNWFVEGAGNAGYLAQDNTMMPNFALSDGVGGHAVQQDPWNSAYRQIDLAAHPDLLDPATNMWGRDGATIWVSFSIEKYAGGTTEGYSGLSLWKAGQAQAEAVLLGSGWDEDQWGIDDEGAVGSPPMFVAGSDASQQARLVYRIDCLPGDERLQMWIDPATPYPSTTADLDTTIVDLKFDEIRISAGGNFGDVVIFDDIEIAKGAATGNVGTNYCAANVNSTGVTGSIAATGSAIVSSNNLRLEATNLPNASFGFFLTSVTQGVVANPGGSAGVLCLGGAIGRYVGPGEILNTGNNGSFALQLDLAQTPTPLGLVSVQAGETWNFSTWHRDSVGGSSTSNFTDGLEVLFL